MKTGVGKFFLFSLGLHVLGFAMLWQNTVYGGAALHTSPNHGSLAPTISAQIIPEKDAQAHSFSSERPLPEKSFSSSSDIPVAKVTSVPSSRTNEEKKEEVSISAPHEDYITAGKLTRLPAPITEIDLDVAEVKEVAVAGSVQLRILINADGTVAEVVSSSDDEALQAFSERVAGIFKRTRFTPGEINGRAVKVQLEIHVVSEDIQAL